MAASEKQKEALARARAARAEKKVADVVETSSGPIVTKSQPVQPSYDGRVWIDGLLRAMQTREVKTVNGIKDCVPLADEVLAQYKAKFN